MPYSCIKVDIDMRWVDERLERRYDLDTVMNVLQIYYDELKNIVNFVRDEEYDVFVFEKMNPSRTGKRENENKDGLHIMYFILTYHITLKSCRERVLVRFADDETFKPLGLSNKLTDIIDKVCMRTQTMLADEEVANRIATYRLTHIFTIDPDEDEITERPVNMHTDRQLRYFEFAYRSR